MRTFPFSAAPVAPGPPALPQAHALYETFHGFASRELRRERQPRVMPPVVVGLGELCGLIYRSDRGQAGRPRTFVHFFEQRPRLACDPAGTQLYVVGGRYRIGRRGLEG